MKQSDKIKMVEGVIKNVAKIRYMETAVKKIKRYSFYN
jgi:hypothetical protein